MNFPIQLSYYFITVSKSTPSLSSSSCLGGGGFLTYRILRSQMLGCWTSVLSKDPQTRFISWGRGDKERSKPATPTFQAPLPAVRRGKTFLFQAEDGLVLVRPNARTD